MRGWGWCAYTPDPCTTLDPARPGLEGTALHVSNFACLALALAYLGYIDQARSRMDEALSEARRLGNVYTLVQVLYFAISFDRLARLPPVHMEEFLTRSTEQGFPLYLGWALAIRGRSLVAVGKHRKALRCSRRGWRNCALLEPF
jgi:hypothetical protein